MKRLKAQHGETVSNLRKQIEDAAAKIAAGKMAESRLASAKGVGR